LEAVLSDSIQVPTWQKFATLTAKDAKITKLNLGLAANAMREAQWHPRLTFVSSVIFVLNPRPNTAEPCDAWLQSPARHQRALVLQA
jgi:hypothetical protein